MKLVTVFVPKPYLSALDSLVAKGKYPDRSEAIRMAVRDLLVKEGCLPKAEISSEAMEKLAVAMRLDKTKTYREVTMNFE